MILLYVICLRTLWKSVKSYNCISLPFPVNTTENIESDIKELKQIIEAHQEESNNLHKELLQEQKNTSKKLEIIDKKINNQKQEFDQHHEELQNRMVEIQTIMNNQTKQQGFLLNLVLDLKS